MFIYHWKDLFKRFPKICDSLKTDLKRESYGQNTILVALGLQNFRNPNFGEDDEQYHIRFFNDFGLFWPPINNLKPPLELGWKMESKGAKPDVIGAEIGGAWVPLFDYPIIMI